LRRTDHAGLLGALRRAVLELPAHTDPATRAAAAGGEPLPEPMGSYLEKVRDQSWRIGDDDIAGLRAAGLTEDQIFELTVAAALGAATRSLDAGLRAVREDA
jgi:alkylhydroperoxidase family enzyme